MLFILVNGGEPNLAHHTLKLGKIVVHAGEWMVLTLQNLYLTQSLFSIHDKPSAQQTSPAVQTARAAASQPYQLSTCAFHPSCGYPATLVQTGAHRILRSCTACVLHRC